LKKWLLAVSKLISLGCQKTLDQIPVAVTEALLHPYKIMAVRIYHQLQRLKVCEAGYNFIEINELAKVIAIFKLIVLSSESLLLRVISTTTLFFI